MESRRAMLWAMSSTLRENVSILPITIIADNLRSFTRWQCSTRLVVPKVRIIDSVVARNCDSLIQLRSLWEILNFGVVFFCAALVVSSLTAFFFFFAAGFFITLYHFG